MTRARWLALLSVASGAFGINYEVLFYRLITSSFGDLLHVQAAILATFLTGIALGSRLSGRLRRFLWLIEMSVGVAAALIGWALEALDRSPWLATIGHQPLATVLLCSALVALPAILVGLSVPIFSDMLATLRGPATGTASFRWIYALYNLGAVASVLVVEYWAVRDLGHRATLHLVAAGNITVGLCLLLFFRVGRADPGPLPESGEPAGDRAPRFPSAAVFLIGIGSSLFQLIFVRACFEIMEPKREVFALTLALVLLGFPLGTWLGRRLRLAGAIHLATIAIGVAFLVFSWLPSVYDVGLRLLAEAGASGVGRTLWAVLFLLILGLVPFTCFGAVLPIVLRPFSSEARTVGRAMFWAGLGNALGFLLYVLLANRLLAEAGQLLLAIALLQAGAVAGEGWRRFARDRLGGVLALAAVTALALGFSAERYFLHHFPMREYRLDPEVSRNGSLWLRVARWGGDNAGIIVFRDMEGRKGKRLFYRGRTSLDASIDGAIAPTEVISGVIPALAAPRLERACVLGIGTGITAGTVARLFERTEAVEINAAVIELLPEFSAENFDLHRNPNARVVLDDARTFLLGKEGVYDLVVNSVSEPTIETAAKVFTTEFFLRAKRSLRPGGVFATWIGLKMNDAAVEAVVGSLRRSFRHASAVFLAQGYLMLLCSDVPIRVGALDRLRLPPAMEKELLRLPADGRDLEEYLHSLVLTHDFFSMVPDRGLHNSDDRPAGEYLAGDPSIPRTFQRFVVEHAELLRFDAVRGRALSEDELSRRCLRYTAELLIEACRSIVRPSVEQVRVFLDLPSLWQRPLNSYSTEELHRWRERLSLLAEVAPTDEEGRKAWAALTVELATRLPLDAALQAEAAAALESDPARSTEAERFRYRALALDSAFRRFQPVPAPDAAR
jgi:spermidine synthase